MTCLHICVQIPPFPSHFKDLLQNPAWNFGLALALAGCAANWETDGTFTGFVKEVANPGSTYEARQAAEKAQQAANDAKCRELGFKPETDAYGNCRLQLEQIRATKQAAAAQRAAAQNRQHQPRCRQGEQHDGNFVFC